MQNAIATNECLWGVTSWQQPEVPVPLMNKLPLTLLYVLCVHVWPKGLKILLSTHFPERMNEK